MDIDMEKIENKMEEAQQLQRAGFMNMQHYIEYKKSVCYGFMKFGGSFLEALGGTLKFADVSNSIKILRYWRAEAEEHSLVYKMYRAKKRAELDSK